jgi:predicted metal-dependent peptidase
MKEKEDENDQWAKTPRRLSCFHPDFYLPYEERSTRKVKDKHEAWFFLDNSGSCDQESKLFFGAYKTVPKKYFETRLFAFDTEVTEIDKEKGEFPYGGGTSFSCIEKFIRKEIARRNIEYPEVVFVLTDGYGDRVNPHFPDRWVWINTTDCDNCIPKQSGVHRFQDMGFISRKENT